MKTYIYELRYLGSTSRPPSVKPEDLIASVTPSTGTFMLVPKKEDGEPELDTRFVTLAKIERVDVSVAAEPPAPE